MSELNKAAEEYASHIDSMNQGDWEAERAFHAGALWQREQIAGVLVSELGSAQAVETVGLGTILYEELRKLNDIKT